MEIDDIQTQGFKFPSIRGGVETDGDSNKMASRFGEWPSSRIVRVSRASGGKDRHSKVLTSRGPRDRRIRLSVTTAIQFYDLQDRLGYDQPSKAVEWLLQAASTSIDELPSINSPFPETPKQISDGKRSSPEPEREDEPIAQQRQRVSISKSTCSSTNSETSKGSGLSLSRCATRVKARERARGRAAEKDKGKEHRSLISDTSFTELLSSGVDKYHNSSQESNLFKKSTRQGQWSTSPMDCFATGFSGSPSSSSAGFSNQIHMPNSNNNTTFPISMSVSPFNVDHHPHPHPHPHPLQQQHFSLLPDISPSAAAGEYNLNFKISPASFSGYSRGTLQSNSQSLSTMPHLQRFSHIDGSNLPLFIGTTSSTSAPDDNSHHQFPAALEGRSRLHLGYGDGFLHSDHKGKGKN